jgi:hypothetical protein
MGALLLLALVSAACGGATATFDPAGPCILDGRLAGAFPDLEALLPADLDGDPPTTVDSGRNCSELALGSLAQHEVEAVEFAGATWDLGGGLGVSSVVFRRLPSTAGEALPAAWIAEFYEVGARTAKRTDNIETSRPTFDGTGETWRLDTLNSLSLQTVVTWQDGALVRSVLVATTVAPGVIREAHDELVAAAVRASVEAAPAAP